MNRVRVRRKILRIFVCLLIAMVWAVQSITIDNDLIGEPDIECLDSQIRVWIKTRKPFAGRIYAMGKADDEDCSKDDFNKHKTKKPKFDLPLGMCGMKSLRSMDPRGMYYGVTLVVSFHPLFITKVDQAFHVKCFFEEVNRGLTAELGVSMIPTTELEARHGIPGCTYSIHRSSIEDLDAGRPAGPPIQFARVGEKVLHQWHCDDSMFGVLINNCYVTDGVSSRATVIDQRGCPVDPLLITGIRYSSDLQRAYAESQVFKFADRPGLWFFCQIRMCMKKDGMCDDVTPPAGCATTTPPLISGKKKPTKEDTREEEEDAEQQDGDEEEYEGKTTLEPEDELEEEYEETTVPTKTTTRHRSQKKGGKKGGKKLFDADNNAPVPPVVQQGAPDPVPYGAAPPAPIQVSDQRDSAPTVFGPGFSPDRDAFEGAKEHRDEPSTRKAQAHTDFETNDDLRPVAGKQKDAPASATRLSTSQSKKDYVDYDSDVTIPPTLTDLLANLPEDVGKEGIQKMLRDSVMDRRALLNSMDDLMSRLRDGKAEVRRPQHRQARPKRRPGEKVDRMEVSWDSARMRDQVIVEDDAPTISGQLLIYDLDETPPVGQVLREYGVRNEHVQPGDLNTTASCAISRQGLLVLAMSLGSLVSTLLFVLGVMCLKQHKSGRGKSIYN